MELKELDPKELKVDMTKSAEEYARLQNILAERESLLRQVNEKKRDIKRIALNLSAELSKLSSACTALKKVASMSSEECGALHQMISTQGVQATSVVGQASARNT